MTAVFATLALQDSGLTFSEVIRDIPHDGASIVVYSMIGAFIVLVWRGSRKKA
jgi:hypothetical protein